MACKVTLAELTKLNKDLERIEMYDKHLNGLTTFIALAKAILRYENTVDATNEVKQVYKALRLVTMQECVAVSDMFVSHATIAEEHFPLAERSSRLSQTLTLIFEPLAAYIVSIENDKSIWALTYGVLPQLYLLHVDDVRDEKPNTTTIQEYLVGQEFEFNKEIVTLISDLAAPYIARDETARFSEYAEGLKSVVKKVAFFGNVQGYYNTIYENTNVYTEKFKEDKKLTDIFTKDINSLMLSANINYFYSQFIHALAVSFCSSGHIVNPDK